MCMGGSNAGDQALQQQQQQQQNIETGTAQLNRIFNGGTIGVNQISGTQALNPTGSYYDALGNRVQGSQAQSLLGQGLLFGGTQNEQGFGPGFYAKRAQDYVNYANPQLTQQYQQTARNLGTRLQDQGLTNSSAARGMGQSLQTAFAQQQRNIADQGTGLAQQLQTQIGQEQNTLQSQLLAGQSPANTSISALNAATGFIAPSTFQPVGDFLGNWLQIYGGNRLAGTYNGAAANPQTNQTVNPYYNQYGNQGGQFAPIG